MLGRNMVTPDMQGLGLLWWAHLTRLDPGMVAREQEAGAEDRPLEQEVVWFTNFITSRLMSLLKNYPETVGSSKRLILRLCLTSCAVAARESARNGYNIIQY